jgi:hypothetical protein
MCTYDVRLSPWQDRGKLCHFLVKDWGILQYAEFFSSISCSDKLFSGLYYNMTLYRSGLIQISILCQWHVTSLVQGMEKECLQNMGNPLT